MQFSEMPTVPAVATPPHCPLTHTWQLLDGDNSYLLLFPELCRDLTEASGDGEEGAGEEGEEWAGAGLHCRRCG